jgi:hypothetical protein
MQRPALSDLPTHHFFRRTARAKREEYKRAYPDGRFRVVSAVRGPFGWRVERY